MGEPTQVPVEKHIPFLIQKAQSLRGRRVLVVGDVGLDEYVLGQVRRISPEAPVPVVEVETEEGRLGLSANVAQNIVGLGGIPLLVSVVGRDGSAEQLRGLLRTAGVSDDHLLVDESRPTTKKLRVMVQNHHIVRVDFEQRQFLKAALESQLMQQVKSVLPSVDVVILQDYAKGVISEAIAQEVIRLSRSHGKKILVDPHRTTPVRYYRGADLLKANFEESMALSGYQIDELRADPNTLNRVGQDLMKALANSQLVITRGKDGMRLFEGETVRDMPTYARQVFDVTGAGDTAIAALALAWGSGFTLEQSCALANFASGVVVGKIGCVPCTVAELIEYVRTHVDA